LILRIDLHVHTRYSDSRASLSEVLEEAQRKGLDGLAITDHKTVKGALKAMKIQNRLIIIPGQEVKTRRGEILALGIRRRIEENLPVRETLNEIHAQGGLAVLPHPTIPFFKGLNENEIKKLPIDGIEVFSAITPLPGYFLRKNLRLARSLGLSITAGSDSHFKETVGDAYTIVYCKDRNIPEILKAIKNGKTRIGGRPSAFSFKVRAAIGTIPFIAHKIFFRKKYLLKS